jgi:hypothetical protein
MKRFATLLIAFAACSWVVQSAPEDPFIGTWKLNVSKSKFEPPPAPTSETVTIGADGKVTVQTMTSDGAEEWSYTYMQDQESPITGMTEGSSVKEHRAGDTVEHSWKARGGNYTGKGTLTKNGTVMTYVFDGTRPDGKHEHDVMIFEKQ